MKHSKPFTMLELIAVIGAVIVVVVILSAALSVALSGGPECGIRKAYCVNNLSQIGRAFLQYVMSWDDWYPTTMRGLPKNEGKWVKDAKALDLLRSQDLLTYPKYYMCPDLYYGGYEPAENNKPLTPKNVGYVWNEGLMGTASTMSGICSDAYNTPHTNNGAKHWWAFGQVRGHFVRGDGSVATADGKDWVKEMKTKEDMMLTLP